MIEFTPDGPFSKKADQLFPGRVRIIGLGQTGAAACDQLVLHGRPGQDLWVFDSDQQTIESSVVPNRHLLGHGLVHGLGCNGDVDLAREIVATENEKLRLVSLGCDFLVIALGLAGSTGVAMAESLIEMGREAGAKVIIIGVQPFAFEGMARRERSVQAIADLRAAADSVLILAHDRIAENPAATRNIRHGFHIMHQLIAQIAQALAQIVCKRGLIQLSFADVRSLYGRYTGSEVLENCWAAHAVGDVGDRSEDLVAQLLGSPLLSDEAIWKQVDHAIVAVSGTEELNLAGVQEIVGALKDRLPAAIPIATSASLEQEQVDKITVTLLLATTAPARLSAPEIISAAEMAPAQKPRPIADTAPLPVIKTKPQPLSSVASTTEPAPKKPKSPPKPTSPPVPVAIETPVDFEIDEPDLASSLDRQIEPPITKPEPAPARLSRRFEARQEEMSFEGPPRGRFEKTHETMYRGENLDQPTYRRRGLKIKV